MAARSTHALTVGDYVQVIGVRRPSGRIGAPIKDPASILWQIYRRYGQVVATDPAENAPYDCRVRGVFPGDVLEKIACYWDELTPATEEEYVWQCLCDRLIR